MRKIRLLVGLAALTCIPSTHASDDDVKWSGYMDLVGGILKDKPVSDVSGKTQHPGSLDYENRFTGMHDSIFALQASKRLNDKLSVTGQFIARGSEQEFQAGVSWAYGSYDIDDNSTIRFGRLGMPTFYYSDFVDVGTTYHWVSPPAEVYDFQLHYEGLDYIRHDSTKHLDFTTEIYGGSLDQDLHRPDGSVVSIKDRDILGISFMSTLNSWLTARLMTMNSEASTTSNLNFEPLLEPARAYTDSAGITAIANSANVLLNTDFSQYKYYNALLKADFDNWFIMAEGMRSDGGELFRNKNRRWYASAGIRFGKVVSYFTFARSEDDSSPVPSIGALAGLTGINKAIADNLATSVVNGAEADNKSYTVGVRIDTTRSTAVKVELTQFEEFASSPSETAGIGKNMLLRAAFDASF